MATNELTALAAAVGVLAVERHRPPLGHVSPSAAAVRHGCAADNDAFIPTWRELIAAAFGIVGFWALYVAAWVMFGGAA